MTKSELLKVIRAHCLDCCCGEMGEVKNCGCSTCNLHPYRFGTDPYKRELSPEQLERLAEMRARREKNRQESCAGGV